MAAEQDDRVWVAECSVCKQVTASTCSKCSTEFYCSKEHEKQDKKRHKRECIRKRKIVSQWKKGRVLDLEKDILKKAADVFMKKYVSMDQKVGTWTLIPKGIREENGNKIYAVQPLPPEDDLPMIMKKFYLDKGFTEEMFYEVYSLSKASIYHSAVVLAIRDLHVLYNTRLELGGHPIKFYGMAIVNVSVPHPNIGLTYTEASYDHTRWKTEILTSKKHKILLFDSDAMGRLIVDFTSAQYGIMRKDVTGCDFPIWICPEIKQEAYTISEVILPSDLDEEISKMISENACKANPDFFAIAVMTYKNSILQRIVADNYLQFKKSVYPDSAQRVQASKIVDMGGM